jgi:hypothetical protein
MELITVNLSGKVRSERLHGREYLVAPLSMIVPGVLNGSQGPLLYELPDIKATADAWNNMPIVAPCHPMDEHGNPVSARTPKIIEAHGIGHVFNSRVDSKLSAEGWFDVERTRKIDARILNAIQSGQQVELSTGLNLDQEPAAGVWNNGAGKSANYTAIARRFRPDHLAILPDAKGACSKDDGCGINVNEANGQANFLSSIVSTVRETVSSLLTGQQAASVANEENKMEKLTPEQRTTIINTLVGNCDCWKGKQEELGKTDDLTLTTLNKGLEAEKRAADAEKKVKDQETILNAAKQGVKIGDEQFIINDTGVWTRVEKKQEPVVNKGEPQPIKFENLPAEMQEDLIFARNAKQARKDQLVAKLVANIADPKAKATQAERISKRSLADLEADAELLPTVNQQQSDHYERNAYAPDYSGAGAGGFDRVINKEDKPEPLGLPVWNFEPVRSDD